jgi:hypothetical protein
VTVAGAVPAFESKQMWRVVSGTVPSCPVGTEVTLTTRGQFLDVARPWAGLAASVDMSTTSVLVSPDGRSCMIRLSDGDAVFTKDDGQFAGAPGPTASGLAAPGLLGSPPMPLPLPPELARSGPLKYLEGTWRSPGYRSGRTRARVTLALFVILLVGAIWQVLLQLEAVFIATRAVGGDRPTLTQQESFSKTLTISSGVYGWAIILLAIAFWCWISRTVDNEPPLGAGTPRDSPRWSIGWWFVPIADFWRPYLVVREAWDRLSSPARPAGGRIVETWWITLLGGFFLGKVAQFMWSGVEDWKAVQIADVVSLVGLLLYVVAAVFGFIMVREIQARADLRAEALGFAFRPATLPFVPAYAVSGSAGGGGPVAPPPPITPRVQPKETGDALRHLIELKDQGLISDEEYAAKRIEVLSRL